MLKENINLTIVAKSIIDIYYNIDFNGNKISDNCIARETHGGSHVSRVAIYIETFANLYRIYGDKDSEKLTPINIKLLQIAGLLHDSARKEDGIDYWDKESASNCYNFLFNEIGADSLLSKEIAESIANKDIQKTLDGYVYEELVISSSNTIIWESKIKPSKSVFQKIMHDADSLDIERVKTFEKKYLDFYQQIAISNTQANYQLDKVIAASKYLIKITGDNPFFILRKIIYENSSNCFLAIISECFKKRHSILVHLGISSDLIV